MIALALLALTLAQDVPIVEGGSALGRLSADMSEHVARCGVKVVFVVPKGKKLDDAKAVLDQAATPEQIACAKSMVSWLLSHDDARKAGYVR